MKELLKDHRQQLAAAILLLMMLLLLLMGTPNREINIVKAYFWPAAIAMTAIMALQLYRKPSAAGITGVALSLWFLVCNILNGDYYLLYNMRFMFGMWMTFGLCLPLMLVLDDKSREKWLVIYALLYGLYMLLLSLVCSYAAWTEQKILFPGMEGDIGITSNRLYALCKHPNELGCSMNIAMLCWLILAVKTRKPLLRVLCLLALLPLAFSIGLTASRTSIVTAALVFGAAATVVVTAKLVASRRWLRWMTGAVSLVVVTVVTMWLLNAGVPLLMKDRTLLVESRLLVQTAVAEEAENAPKVLASSAKEGSKASKSDSQLEQRTFSQSFGTFSMRTEIWEAGVEYIKQNPRVLLFGSTDGQVSRIPRWQLGRSVSHMHNSWLEMLIQVGVLGFAAYVFIIGRMMLSSARQVFNVALPAWRRILAAAPVVMLVCTLMEIYPCVSGNVMDMMYMVLTGAVIALDPGRKKAALPQQ